MKPKAAQRASLSKPVEDRKAYRKYRETSPKGISLADAYLAPHLERIRRSVRYYPELKRLKPQVAKAAVDCFQSELVAAEWLTENQPGLPGGTPLELCFTDEGCNAVIAQMERVKLIKAAARRNPGHEQVDA